jgi:trafficking protein particle complex subunit 6
MSFESVMPPYNSQDPTASFLSISCLDFLLIELVPLAYRVTNELEPALPSLPTQQGDTSSTSHNGGTGAISFSTGGIGGAGGVGVGSARKMDEDEERDAVFHRLEELGYRVGQGLVERYVFSPRKRQFVLTVGGH